jgi:hypothetical protein
MGIRAGVINAVITGDEHRLLIDTQSETLNDDLDSASGTKQVLGRRRVKVDGAFEVLGWQWSLPVRAAARCCWHALRVHRQCKRVLRTGLSLVIMPREPTMNRSVRTCLTCAMRPGMLRRTRLGHRRE